MDIIFGFLMGFGGLIYIFMHKEDTKKVIKYLFRR
jgi:hypothetical protein